MLISSKHIIDCIKAAQEADELFALNTRQNGEFDRSIDDFRKFIKTYGDVRVLDHKLSFSGEPIRGATITYDDHYDVVILSGQDPYWRRFVEFKELFHVILDSKDKEHIFRNHDYVKQVENTLASFPDITNKSDNFVACEKLAEISAMEFLMPYSRRKELVDKISSGELDLYKIANMYQLPTEIIDLYLSEPYIERIGECINA